MEFTTNQNILDVLQLYEYAMSIGKSLDYEENCSQFLRLVLKRKNLNACWIIVVEKKHAQIVYAIPNGENIEKIQSEELIEFLKTQKAPLFSEVNEIHKRISPIDLDKGYICMHPLEEEGYLYLYSKHKPIQKDEIIKLSPVINKFSKTLEACRVYSSQNRILRKLEDQNHELNDYAHVVSHDLKSPLRNIETMISWIEEDLNNQLKDETLNYLNRIRENISKMEGLISGILSYSSVGSDFSRDKRIDMNKCLRSLLDYNFIPKHITIELPNNLPVIKGDTYRVEQLFQNLINNAIKYNNKKRGLVQITYEDKDTFHQFSIKDNGIGIDPKYHSKIFQTFQKLHYHKDSSGVGLSIVKRIVQSYDGKIWLDSQLGEGTTFSFTLKKML